MCRRIASLLFALVLVAAAAPAGTDALATGVCGDDVLDAGEECDDGNTASGDCCSATCTFETAGSACADDGLECTADVCDGSGACTHPAGNAGTICRPAAGDCDVAERCTGGGVACPADAFKAPGTACTADANPCTSDRCDGSGACTHPPGNAGTICRAATTECDVAEACDGSSTSCPADSGEPDTDGDDVCDAQDPCTNLGHGQDFKPRPKPVIGLKRINDNVIPGDDQLKIVGTFDLAVGQTFDMLDPSLTGARVLLLNANGGVEVDVHLPPGVYAGRGTRGWATNLARNRWTYTDKTSDGLLATTYAGIHQLRLVDRSRRTPREVQVKAIGRFGTYPVLMADSPVRAVVVFGGQSASIAGWCGESNFVADECRFNRFATSLDCRH